MYQSALCIKDFLSVWDKPPVTLERIDVRMRSVPSTHVYVGKIEHFSKLCVCSTHKERMGNEFSVCSAYAERIQWVQLIMSLRMTTNLMPGVCPAYGLRTLDVPAACSANSQRMPCVLATHADQLV